MARTVVITSADRQGDAVFVTGTVDGVPATAIVWWSHLSTLATPALRQAFVAGALAASVPVSNPIGINGTVLV